MLQENEQTISLPRSAIARALLAYLLYYAQQPISRAILIDQFWPNRSEKAARRALSQALWRIRHTLPNFVTTVHDTLQITPHLSVWVDVTTYITLAKPHIDTPVTAPNAYTHLRQAITHYQGELLMGMYDEWIEYERKQIARLHRHVLQKLARIEKLNGRYMQALQLTQQLVQQVPLNEAHHRELIRLYLLLNQPAAAYQQYQRCQAILRQKINTEPEIATRQLIETVATQETPHLAINKRNVRLIGRTEEYDYLQQRLDSLFQGQGGLCLIEGEAGIGKTHLVQVIAQQAEWRGAQLFWSAGYEHQTTVAFVMVKNMWDDKQLTILLPQLRQIISPLHLQVLEQMWPIRFAQIAAPTPPTLPLQQEKERLEEALVATLQGISRLTPLIIIWDDIQWADDDSLKLLPKMVRRLQNDRILFILTSRDIEVRAYPVAWQTLLTLTKTTQQKPLSLNKLDRAAVGRLIRNSLQATKLSHHLISYISTEANGNPLFILEMLHSLREAGIIYETPKGWQLKEIKEGKRPFAFTSTLTQIVNHRLALLPSHLKVELEAAAVLGQRIDYQLLAHVTAQSAITLSSILAQLVNWHFLKRDGDTYQFIHVQLQQIIYDSIPPAQKRYWHRQAAQKLSQQTTPDSSLLAYHYQHGEVWDKAITYLIEAARQAEQIQAYHTAIQSYNITQTLLQKHTPFPRPQTLEITFNILMARYNLTLIVGDKAEAKKDIDSLLQLAQTLDQPIYHIQVLTQKANFLYTAEDNYEEARSVAQQAATLAQTHAYPIYYIKNLYTTSKTLIANGRYQEAEPILKELWQRWPKIEASLYKELPPTDQQSLALLPYNLVITYWRQGKLGEAEELSQKWRQAIEKTDNAYLLSFAHQLQAIIASAQDDNEARIHHNQISLRYAQQIGLHHLRATLLVNLTAAYLYIPNYQAAIDAIQQSIVSHEKRDDNHGLVAAYSNLGDLLVEVGQYEEAYEYLEKALILAKSDERPLWQVWILSSWVHMYLRINDRHQAQKALTQARQLLAKQQAPFEQACTDFAAGCWHWQGGDIVNAAILFEQAYTAALQAGVIDYALLIHSHLALAKQYLDDPQTAVILSQKIVKKQQALSGQQFAATVYYHHGHILHAAGKETAAFHWWQQAYHVIQTQKETLPDKTWHTPFCHQVPLNHAICKTFQRLEKASPSSQITVFLPPAQATQRGPIDETNKTAVTWTIHKPSDKTITNKVARRQHRLRRLLNEADAQNAIPTQQNLADALNVTRQTIVRDLKKLRQSGYEFKTRGRQS